MGIKWLLEAKGKGKYRYHTVGVKFQLLEICCTPLCQQFSIVHLQIFDKRIDLMLNVLTTINKSNKL